MFSKEFYNTAIEMGYSLPVNLNPEVQVAVHNQMKRDIEETKKQLWKPRYAAPEDLQDECTFNGEVHLQPAVDRKDVAGKPDPLLLPYEAAVAYSKVSDYGMQKYGNRCSWVHSTDGVAVYAAAAARHLFKHAGETSHGFPDAVDPESGLPHLYHALWSVAAAIWHLEQKK